LNEDRGNDSVTVSNCILRDKTCSDFDRAILLWDADIAVPKCAGSDYWTRPQCQEGCMSSVGPVDRHGDTCATPSTESIVCIYFENLHSKVMCEMEMKRLMPNEKAPWDMKH
jgi:hypothetical protein